MAEGELPLNAPTTSGKTLATEELTNTAGHTVARQQVEITGAGLSEVARVQNSTPAGTEQALVTRNIPSGTQPVSGTVAVSNLPATQPVSGTVAVSSLPAMTGTVAVNNFPATQPVSGSVSVSNLPATQAISAAALPLPSGAAQEHTAAATPSSIRLSDGAAFYKPTTPSDTQPVSGTFWQATQPVSAASLPLPSGAATAAKQPTLGTAGSASADVMTVQGVASMTALKVDGSAVTQPVSGSVSVSNFPATQPISGTVTANQGTAGATAWKVDGSAVTQPVSGAFFQATQPVSAASLPLPTGASTDSTLSTMSAKLPAALVSGRLDVNLGTSLPAAAAISNSPIGSVSMGNSLGKANVLKTGSLASVATTADQVILTYTVTSGKTFYLQYLKWQARLTTYTATATNFGAISLETPSGTKVLTEEIFHAGIDGCYTLTFDEPIPIAAAVVVRVVCTPSAATAFTWRASFGGYEK